MDNLNEELVGKTLNHAKNHLERMGMEISYRFTSGGKDKDLLSEPYVVRVKTNANKADILLSCFKTMI